MCVPRYNQNELVSFVVVNQNQHKKGTAATKQIILTKNNKDG